MNIRGRYPVGVAGWGRRNFRSGNHPRARRRHNWGRSWIDPLFCCLSELYSHDNMLNIVFIKKWLAFSLETKFGI